VRFAKNRLRPISLAVSCSEVGPIEAVHPACRRLAIVSLFAITWSSIAYCGPIHDAAARGDLAKVKALLKDNPELVSSRDNWGDTPLDMAVRYRHKDVVKLLLAKGVDINAKTGGYPPLFTAVESGQKEIVELLLAKGAEVNAKIGDGETPLHMASTGIASRKDIAELLLAKGADINAKTTADRNGGLDKGGTPLHLAAEDGHKDVVELLLAKGADINAKNGDGTPLHMAAGHGRYEVAELLLAKGAEVNAENYDGETPLQVAEKKWPGERGSVAPPSRRSGQYNVAGAGAMVD